MDELWNYQEQVEQEIDRIRRKALLRAQAINPRVSHVVDNFTFDDYCEKTWDYPGAWYCSFRLPKGIKTEAELIEKIVRETLAHFNSQ